MADIKKLKRLATAGTVQFDGSVNVVHLSSLEDGGDYDLHPFATENGNEVRIYFPATNAPGYGVAVEGDLESLGRFARAILALERKSKDGEDANAEPATATA